MAQRPPMSHRLKSPVASAPKHTPFPLLGLGETSWALFPWSHAAGVAAAGNSPGSANGLSFWRPKIAGSTAGNSTGSAKCNI